VSAVRKAGAIALLSLAVTVRDRTALIWRLVMPVVMTVLVGSVFGGAAAAVRTPVAVVDEDDSAYSRLFSERLGTEDTIRIRKTTADLAGALLDEGRTSAVVLIPKGFADRINTGKDADVSVRFDPRRGPPTLVTEVVREVAMRLSVDATAGEFTAALAARETGNPAKAPAIRRRAIERAERRWSPVPPITVTAEAVTAYAPGRRPQIPTGMEQSSPGFAVMFVTLAAAMSAAALVVERQNGTLARLLTTPTPRASILGGKIAGIYLQGLVQMGVLVGVGQSALGVNWGQSPAALAVLISTYMLAATGLGIMLAAFVRTEAQASTLFPVVTIIPSMLGGAWWPIEIMPSYMQAVAYATPQAWAMTGFVNIITRGFGLPEVLPQAVALAAFGLAFFVIGLLAFRFE
jgi:ABC-2 type transport system permease protein